MRAHLISYDLVRPGQQYRPLIDRLTRLGAVRILESTWILRAAGQPEDVRDDLLRYGQLDTNDRLFVAELTGNAAWTSLQVNNPLAKLAITDIAA